MVTNLVIFLLVILFFVYVFKKNKKQWHEYNKLDETPFMENMTPEEKLADSQNEFEKNKVLNNLNKFDAP